MLTVLTRDGINPRRRVTGGKSSTLKVLPSAVPRVTSQSTSLRGSTDACMIVNMHGSISAGKLWVVHGSDGCYGTNQVPLSSQFFVAAFQFTPFGSIGIWTAPHAPAPAPAPLNPTPTNYSLPATSLATDLQNTRADIRRQVAATFDPTPIPEEDDDMHEALPDNNEPLPANVDEAFAHLLQAVDQMHATPPQLPSFDSQHYLALSNLPLTYPWPNLILDLKSYIPLLERHVITHMVAGRCNLQEEHSHPGYVLNSLLKDLAQTIVHNILFPATSAFMRPALPPRVATVEFWHAQLNYAVLRAAAALATGGSAEGIAGDQLCIWNTIAPDAIIRSICHGQSPITPGIQTTPLLLC